MTSKKDWSNLKTTLGFNMVKENKNKEEQLLQLLESAQRSLRSASFILKEVLGIKEKSLPSQKLKTRETKEGEIVEGVFDGENMIGPEGKQYLIPANYASKSKLIPGDILKLTITPKGDFIFKQIGPIERKRVRGEIIQEGGDFRVVAEGKSYKILKAAVTFFKAKPGEEVVLIIPQKGESEWGAIENVIGREEA